MVCHVDNGGGLRPVPLRADKRHVLAPDQVLDLGARAVGDDAAVVQHDDPVGEVVGLV